MQIEPTAGTDLPEEVTVADVEVAVGATATIAPEVVPATASGWCFYAVAPSGRAVCEVDADGNVRGVTPGMTDITVKCAAKPSVNAKVKVTVTGA